jgi:uncharacterized membrane protein YbaN (DUF454 family)
MDLPELLPPPKQRPKWKRVLYVVLAIALIVVGTIGWIVPVVAGFPFWIAAAILLAMTSERVRNWINEKERRMPHERRVKLRHMLQKLPSKRLKRVAQA